MDYLRVAFSIMLWSTIAYMYFEWRKHPDKDKVGFTRFHDAYMAFITTWLVAFSAIKVLSPSVANTNMFLMFDTLYSLASIIFVILFILKLRAYTKKKRMDSING